MNYALCCLLARNALDMTPAAIEGACRQLGRLAKKHATLSLKACNEPGDFDSAIATLEASIRIVCAVYGCSAWFETDPRGITVWIVGSDGTRADA